MSSPLAQPILIGSKRPIFDHTVTQINHRDINPLEFVLAADSVIQTHVLTFLISAANDPAIARFVADCINRGDNFTPNKRCNFNFNTAPAAMQCIINDSALPMMTFIALFNSTPTDNQSPDRVSRIRELIDTIFTFTMSAAHLKSNEILTNPTRLMNRLHYTLRIAMRYLWSDTTSLNMFMTHGYMARTRTNLLVCNDGCQPLVTYSGGDEESFMSPTTNVYPEFTTYENHPILAMDLRYQTYNRARVVSVIVGEVIHSHTVMKSIVSLPWTMSYSFPPTAHRSLYTIAMNNIQVGTVPLTYSTGRYDVVNIIHRVKSSAISSSITRMISTMGSTTTLEPAGAMNASDVIADAAEEDNDAAMESARVEVYAEAFPDTYVPMDIDEDKEIVVKIEPGLDDVKVKLEPVDDAAASSSSTSMQDTRVKIEDSNKAFNMGEEDKEGRGLQSTENGVNVWDEDEDENNWDHMSGYDDSDPEHEDDFEGDDKDEGYDISNNDPVWLYSSEAGVSTKTTGKSVRASQYRGRQNDRFKYEINLARQELQYITLRRTPDSEEWNFQAPRKVRSAPVKPIKGDDEEGDDFEANSDDEDFIDDDVGVFEDKDGDGVQINFEEVDARMKKYKTIYDSSNLRTRDEMNENDPMARMERFLSTMENSHNMGAAASSISRQSSMHAMMLHLKFHHVEPLTLGCVTFSDDGTCSSKDYLDVIDEIDQLIEMYIASHQEVSTTESMIEIYMAMLDIWVEEIRTEKFNRTLLRYLSSTKQLSLNLADEAYDVAFFTPDALLVREEMIETTVAKLRVIKAAISTQYELRETMTVKVMKRRSEYRPIDDDDIRPYPKIPEFWRRYDKQYQDFIPKEKLQTLRDSYKISSELSSAKERKMMWNVSDADQIELEILHEMFKQMIIDKQLCQHRKLEQATLDKFIATISMTLADARKILMTGYDSFTDRLRTAGYMSAALINRMVADSRNKKQRERAAAKRLIDEPSVPQTTKRVVKVESSIHDVVDAHGVVNGDYTPSNGLSNRKNRLDMISKERTAAALAEPNAAGLKETAAAFSRSARAGRLGTLQDFKVTLTKELHGLTRRGTTASTFGSSINQADNHAVTNSRIQTLFDINNTNEQRRTLTSAAAAVKILPHKLVKSAGSGIVLGGQSLLSREAGRAAAVARMGASSTKK